MHITEGHIIAMIVIIMFMGFSVSQIKRSKDDIKNSRGTRWLNEFGVISGAILLIWNLIMAVIVLGSILRLIK